MTTCDQGYSLRGTSSPSLTSGPGHVRTSRLDRLGMSASSLPAQQLDSVISISQSGTERWFSQNFPSCTYIPALAPEKEPQEHLEYWSGLCIGPITTVGLKSQSLNIHAAAYPPELGECNVLKQPQSQNSLLGLRNASNAWSSLHFSNRVDCT